eukprot:TRINITY_DN692_c0_g1_i15.p2 TRINITY_DN692_c0_g1~~TRINITY_DN692_c0_g1_i15.p2  ORF type:complete len:129 (-),score=37.52 TRINITY_DN692_c0_g1_i15:251-637(-)
MLDDVEIVYFERVKVSKTFDLVFVTKDEEYDIVSINHVPSVHLNALTEHFKRIDIKVYQGKYNINWAEVLEFITEKPEEFEACGWKFIEGGEELTHVEDEDLSDVSDFEPSDEMDDEGGLSDDEEDDF